MTDKLTKPEADYRLADSSHTCHNCDHRIDRGTQLSKCVKVKGTVDPIHVCRLWEAEER